MDEGRMIIVVDIICAVSLLIIYLTIILPWQVHISMTKDESNKTGWGNYKLFKELFSLYDWTISDSFKGSFFDYKNDSKYHASIIKFEGIGMKICDPINYMLVRRFVKKYDKMLISHPNGRIDFKQILTSKRLKERDGIWVSMVDGEKIFVSMEEIYGLKKLDQK